MATIKLPQQCATKEDFIARQTQIRAITKEPPIERIARRNVKNELSYVSFEYDDAFVQQCIGILSSGSQEDPKPVQPTMEEQQEFARKMDGCVR